MLFENQKREINMTEGPLFSNIIRYTIPVILTGILQLLFSATDLVVIGNFRGGDSVGAVGATTSLTTLLTGLVIGMATGVSVVAAQSLGAKDAKGVSKVVHTTIPVAAICGVVIAIVGIVFAEPLLTLMDTPATILPKAVLYVRIIFGGTIFNITNNFLSAILRASGDTKRPLIYLTIGGATNVILNIIFVTLFNMDVEGVAIATVIAHTISCLLVINRLAHINEEWKLSLNKIKVDFKMLGKIVKIGLPTGVSSSVFALSNVIIQATINSFGASTVAGDAAASNIDGFIYLAMNAFYQSSLNFTGQNVGAGKVDRIGKVMRANMVIMFVIAVIMGGLVVVFARQLLGIYIVDDPAAIEVGVTKILWICIPYFLCGIMEILIGVARGMGASIACTLISILGGCGLRIVWILTIFSIPQFHTIDCLYLSYALSWTACIIADWILVQRCKSKLKKQLMQ